MNIQDIQKLYGVLPQGNALIKTMEEKSVRTIFLQGLLASATPMFFASIVKRWQKTVLFVLNDNDEAGYFYNDLKTIAMPDGANAMPETRYYVLKFCRICLLLTKRKLHLRCLFVLLLNLRHWQNWWLPNINWTNILCL